MPFQFFCVSKGKVLLLLTECLHGDRKVIVRNCFCTGQTALALLRFAVLTVVVSFAVFNRNSETNPTILLPQTLQRNRNNSTYRQSSSVQASFPEDRHMTNVRPVVDYFCVFSDPSYNPEGFLIGKVTNVEQL